MVDNHPEGVEPGGPVRIVDEGHPSHHHLVQGPHYQPHQQHRLRGTQAPQRAVQHPPGHQGGQVQTQSTSQDQEQDVLQDGDRGQEVNHEDHQHGGGGEHGVTEDGLHGSNHRLEDIGDMFHVAVWVGLSAVAAVAAVVVPMVSRSRGFVLLRILMVMRRRGR